MFRCVCAKADLSAEKGFSQPSEGAFQRFLNVFLQSIPHESGCRENNNNSNAVVLYVTNSFKLNSLKLGLYTDVACDLCQASRGGGRWWR